MADILFITPFYKPAYVHGGPTRSIPALCEGMTGHGENVHVLTTNTKGDGTLNITTGEPKSIDGVQVTYFPCYTIQGRFFYSPSLRRACEHYVDEFDYVYTYGIWNYPAISAGAVCRRYGVPYIVSPRSGLMKWPLRQSWLRKKIYLWLAGYRYLNGAWAVHYTTEVELAESEQIGIDTEGFVVPNSINLSEFNTLPDEKIFRKKLRTASDVPLLLFLGRLEPRKGLKLSLRAFARAKAQSPTAKFIIAGSGDQNYTQQLKSLSNELGIMDAVTFTGFLDSEERLEALATADAFILTSHTENFAMAAVESMATGTPVVLSEEVGVAEGAQAAGAGVSVALDEKKISKELSTILGNPSLRKEMGKNAYTHVRNTYNRRVVAKQMITAIQEHQQRSSS